MTATFPIYPAHTAILSMDCQAGIVSIYAKDDKDAFLTRAASVLNHARAIGMSIVTSKSAFVPAYQRSILETFSSALSNPLHSIRSCFRNR